MDRYDEYFDNFFEDLRHLGDGYAADLAHDKAIRQIQQDRVFEDKTQDVFYDQDFERSVPLMRGVRQPAFDPGLTQLLRINAFTSTGVALASVVLRSVDLYCQHKAIKQHEAIKAIKERVNLLVRYGNPAEIEAEIKRLKQLKKTL